MERVSRMLFRVVVSDMRKVWKGPFAIFTGKARSTSERTGQAPGRGVTGPSSARVV